MTEILKLGLLSFLTLRRSLVGEWGCVVVPTLDPPSFPLSPSRSSLSRSLSVFFSSFFWWFFTVKRSSDGFYFFGFLTTAVVVFLVVGGCGCCSGGGLAGVAVVVG